MPRLNFRIPEETQIKLKTLALRSTMGEVFSKIVREGGDKPLSKPTLNTTSLNLPSDVIRTLDEIASQNGLSRNAAIALLIETYEVPHHV